MIKKTYYSWLVIGTFALLLMPAVTDAGAVFTTYNAGTLQCNQSVGPVSFPTGTYINYVVWDPGGIGSETSKLDITWNGGSASAYGDAQDGAKTELIYRNSDWIYLRNSQDASTDKCVIDQAWVGYQYCSPNSVANGSVGSAPNCTITCNAGYVLSGSSCVWDTTKPTMSVTPGTAGGTYTYSASQAWSYTAYWSDNGGLAYCSIIIDGTSYDLGCSGTSKSYAGNFTTAGTHTIQLWGRDLAGNSKFSSTYTYSLPAPAADIKCKGPTGAASNGPCSINTNDTVTISWSVSNVTECMITKPNGNIVSAAIPTGSLQTVPLTSGPYTWILNCRNASGIWASDTVTVNIAAPTVDITGYSTSGSYSNGPISITSGGPVNLKWTTANSPTSCTASASPANSQWSGSKSITSGSTQTITNVTAGTTFSIYCSNASGSGPTDSFQVKVLLAASLSASPSSGTAPLNNVSLTATASGGTSGTYRYQFDCTSNGTIEKDITVSNNPYTANNLCSYSSVGTYTPKVTISHSEGTAIKSASVSVGSQPTPTADLTCKVGTGAQSNGPCSVDYNGQATVYWSSTNSTYCAIPEQGWTNLATSGNFSGNFTASKTYTLNCYNSAGTKASDTVNINVIPSLTFTASPTSVSYGGASTLSWSSSGATYCTASGDWSGSKSIPSGSTSTGALIASKNYTLACVDGATGLTNTKSASVTVGADSGEPTGTISINSGAAYVGSTAVTLSLTCSDSSGCSQMRFNNDGSSWSSPVAYATSTSWTLTSGDGTKTVYVKFKDGAGNWSTATISDTIILDTTPPTMSITPGVENGTYSSSTIPLPYTASWSDSGSGLSSCWIRIDGTWNSLNPPCSGASGSYSDSLAAGSHTLQLQATDMQGKYAASYPYSYTITDASTPTADIKANDSDGPIWITLNTEVRLSWTSTNAVSCLASGDWSGTKSPSGAEFTSDLLTTKTYSLKCQNSSGVWSTVNSVEVNINPRHSVCSGGTCVMTDGAGTDECSSEVQSGSKCGGDGCTESGSCWHSACSSNKTCIVVEGDGTNECSTDLDCEAPEYPTQYYGLCVQGACVMVEGSSGYATGRGLSTCSNYGGTCPAPVGSSFNLNSSNDLRLNITENVGTFCSNNTTLTIEPLNGFSAAVDLSISSWGTLTGASANFSDSILNSGEYATGSTLNICVPVTTPSGNYDITVRGSGAGKVIDKTVKVILHNAASTTWQEI